MPDPIDLSIGQAHFDVEEEVKAAAIDAIKQGRNRYTVTQGIPALREALMARYAGRFGDVSDWDVMVTSGVSGGLMLSFLALLNPGDEILIPDPYFVMYRHLATMVGAKAVTYDIYPDFRVDAAKVKAKITERTRLIVVNSPSNPTGVAMSEAEARALARLADESGIALISDEIYEDFMYGTPHVSPRQFTSNCIVLSGASKSMGMPGWRIGWMFAPKSLSERMYTLQQFSFVCAPAPLQWAAVKGLAHDFSAHRAEYEAKRNLVYDGLRERYRCVKPEGAFYMFPYLPEGADTARFMDACIKQQLLVVPGSACSDRDTNFRLSFAATNEKLKRAVDILNQVATGL
ncbi:MAG: pyridoxal phosphate-dependent aminotransferase [Planctomycetes bacterium]|nr:pyridoxal phosphate-dependent aminotransferase [Planctomycetota bacterium]MCW8135208.1 pyridoxal phosphate-dependent aminotransferase [Planctomycetota bacterium]